MRFFSVACVTALSASNLVSAGSWFGGNDASVKDSEKVPGDSPLQLCDKDHGLDTVHIKQVDLLPNPPEAYVLSCSIATSAPLFCPRSILHNSTHRQRM